MPKVCNLSSIGSGKCSAHKRTKSVTVLVLTGETTVLTEGSPTMNAVSIGIASCGHPVLVVTTSGTVFAGGSGVVRAGDIVQTVGGSQIMITGASTVTAN